MIEVKLAFRDYQPPFDVERAVRRMLDTVPAKYLGGLSTIIIRNTATLNRERRRARTRSRGRPVAIAGCMALYHHKHCGESAWIELFVDNIFGAWSWWALWLAAPRETTLAMVFFHEIGHHIHASKVPEYKEKEDVADRWRNRLLRTWIRRRFWYLLPLLAPATRVVRLLASHGIIQAPD